MIWMFPDDLSRSVIHHKLDPLTGEEIDLGYHPIWWYWPDVKGSHNIDWQGAEEENTIPHCPHCDFPLMPTGCIMEGEDDKQEYYICRYCEAKCIGPVIREVPAQAVRAPLHEVGLAEHEVNAVAVKEKYRYLIGQ